MRLSVNVSMVSGRTACVSDCNRTSPSAACARRARARPACFATPPDQTEASSSSQSKSEARQLPGPRLTDPVQTIYWGGTVPSTRRVVIGGLSGVAIALGGNLGGVTSWLLGLDGGQLAGSLRADVVVPVRGAKRCVDFTYGFEFTYPAAWLGDQTLAYRAAKRAEAARGGPPGGFGGPSDFNDDEDFPPLSPRQYGSRTAAGKAMMATQRLRPAVAVAEPVAAFGPPGTTGEENVSVIVAPIAAGFTLQSLGDPRAAGERFLTTLAPEGSGLTATLLAAEARESPNLGSGPDEPAGLMSEGKPQNGQQPLLDQLYYSLEYTVRGPRFFRHNLSVYTARDNQLYTFNAQCPEVRWQDDAAVLRASAASFHLLPQ